MSHLNNCLRWMLDVISTGDTRVVCCVEGTDDVFLVDALMDWSAKVIRSSPIVWNDFSYESSNTACRVVMQISVANMPQLPESDRTGVFEFVYPDCDTIAKFQRWIVQTSSLCQGLGNIQWMNVSDGDLNFSVLGIPALVCQPNCGVRSFIWKSRGIENMLLHPTCVLWLVRNDLQVASAGFREIFKSMSKKFFGSACSQSHSIFSCAKMAGPGWLGWHEIPFEESKLPQYSGMAPFLKRVVDAVLVSGSSVGSAMLVFFEFFREVRQVPDRGKEQRRAVSALLTKYANIVDLMSKECPDVELFRQELQRFSGASSYQGDCVKALWCMEHALIDNQQASMILGRQSGLTRLVSKEARSAFWERNNLSQDSPGPASFIHAFPRFLCFLNGLCCANGIDSGVQAAARSCTSAVFRVLCAVVFGMEDDAYVRHEGLNSIIFRSQTAMPCSGYVPHSGGESCLCCEQPDDCHVLKHDCQRCDTDNEIQFMRVACRVGSMGWDSHALMKLVHGNTHLGSFRVSAIASSQLSYRQHLYQHIFGAHPTGRHFSPCDICSSKSLALDSLPVIVREEVQRLQQERREEFACMIDAVDSLFHHDGSPVPESFSIPHDMASHPNAGATDALVSPRVTASKSTDNSSTPPAASSPKSPASLLPFPLVQCTNVHIATAVSSLGPAYEACAKSIIDSDIDGRVINEIVGSTNTAELYDFITRDLGITSIMLRTKLKNLFCDMRAAAVPLQLLSAVTDHSHEKMLWMKACFVLEACTKGTRPFVGLVFERLHIHVIQNVQMDIKSTLGSCEVEDWACSSCGDAADAKFTDDGPVTFQICAMDINGVTQCSDFHDLKPHVYVPCYLKNIPAACFSDADAISASLPLLICPNPADLEKPKTETSGNSEHSNAKRHCPTVIFFHKLNLDPSTQYLSPFLVTRCMPGDEPALEFHAVLCFSRPSHTEKLVEAFQKQEPLPKPRETSGFSFAFWVLARRGTDSFQQQKLSVIGLKQGHILRFDGDNLPHCIISGCRYMITGTSNYSFDVDGPILCPVSPFCADALSTDDSPFNVIKRSPIGRFRDAARKLHTRGTKAEHHWSGIRANRLSSHHGEFCKLFCSHTSRELDFFYEKGTRSGEQLLNMIDMCKAFSIDDECSVFCSLFQVNTENRELLKLALQNLRTAAVGRTKSNQLKESGVKDLRNMMFHDFLTLDSRDFEVLVACAKQLLEAIRVVLSIVGDDRRSDYAVQALAEIEDLVHRDVTVEKLSDSERQVFERRNEQMLEEFERIQEEHKLFKAKLGRKFDSFAVCLKSDIQNDLKEGNQIGRTGGQGTVYRVLYRGQTLAVKLFNESKQEGAARKRELNSLTLLTHTNIVRMFYTVYDTLEDRRLSRPPLGYAMEKMARSADDQFECTFHQLLCVFEQIASALTFAHEHNVIHFDVKPENILLDESCSVAKLCDFGCAITLHTTASLTSSVSGVGGKIRGTVLYMAPETFDGIIEDHEKAKLCDIYSFGKTMWKLLHPQGKLYPQSEENVTADVPPALKNLVEKCTRRLPSARPQSMSEVQEQLRSILHALHLHRKSDHHPAEDHEVQSLVSAGSGKLAPSYLTLTRQGVSATMPQHAPALSYQPHPGPSPKSQQHVSLSQALPLPPDWTEMIMPDGRSLYRNELQQRSSYERPVPLQQPILIHSECYTGSFDSLDALCGMLDAIQIVTLEVALLGDGDASNCLCRIHPSAIGMVRGIVPSVLADMIQVAREIVQRTDAARILPPSMHGVPTIDLLAAVCLFTMDQPIPIWRYITVPLNGGAARTPESLKNQLPFMKFLSLGLRCLPKDSPYFFRGTLYHFMGISRTLKWGDSDTYKVGSTVIFPAPCTCSARDSDSGCFSSGILFIMPDSTGIRLHNISIFPDQDEIMIDGPSFWEVLASHMTNTSTVVVILKRAPAVQQYLSEDFHIDAEREHNMTASRKTVVPAHVPSPSKPKRAELEERLADQIIAAVHAYLVEHGHTHAGAAVLLSLVCLAPVVRDAIGGHDIKMSRILKTRPDLIAFCGGRIFANSRGVAKDEAEAAAAEPAPFLVKLNPDAEKRFCDTAFQMMQNIPALSSSPEQPIKLTDLLHQFRVAQPPIQTRPYGGKKEVAKCGLKMNHEILRDDVNHRFVVEQRGALYWIHVATASMKTVVPAHVPSPSKPKRAELEERLADQIIAAVHAYLVEHGHTHAGAAVLLSLVCLAPVVRDAIGGHDIKMSRILKTRPDLIAFCGKENTSVYSVSAEPDDADALFNLGFKFESGLGVVKDEAEAVRLYRLAADQGHAAAQYNLGVRYENGRGVSRTEAEAVRLYRLAADQGHAQAQNELGRLFYSER